MGIMEKKMETTILRLYTPLVPFLGTLNIRCRIIIGTQNGTIILTTTHMTFSLPATVASSLNPASGKMSPCKAVEP